MDWSQFSDSDLEQISKGDLRMVSESALKLLAGEQKPKVEKRSFGDELLRQGGLTLRHGISGIASLPNMFGNAAAGLYNFGAEKLGYDSRLPTSTQSLDGLLDRYFPKPETSTERVAQDVSTALASAGGTAAAANRLAGVPQAARSFFGDNLGLQAAAATTGAGAAATARESGADPSTQLGAALLAGTVAPTGITVAQTVGKVPVAIAGQFTKGGRESTVGSLLNYLSESPNRTLARLKGDIPEYVPGSVPTAGQASLDRGLMAAENFVKGLGTTTRSRFANASTGNNAARMRLLGEVAGDNPSAITAAESARDAATAPLREAAFATPSTTVGKHMIELQPTTVGADINPIRGSISNILSSPVGVREDVKNAMNWVEARLGDRMKDPATLYELRKDISNNLLRGKYDKDAPGANLARKELQQIVSAIDDSLESSAPGFKNYMAKYREMSRPVTRMEGGQKLRYDSTDTVVDEISGFPTLSQPKWERNLGKMLEDKDFVNSLDPKHMEALTRISQDLNRSAQSTSNPMRLSGSDTLSNMSMFGALTKVLGGVDAGASNIRSFGDKFSWLTKLTEKETNELLADALLDPKLAVRLMQKANEMSAQSLSNTLKQRAKISGYGQLAASD